MKSSQKSPDHDRYLSDPHPLAAGGGIRVEPADSRNPYEVLDDLMTVIEAFCPEWPSREPFGDMPCMKL